MLAERNTAYGIGTPLSCARQDRRDTDGVTIGRSLPVALAASVTFMVACKAETRVPHKESACVRQWRTCTLRDRQYRSSGYHVDSGTPRGLSLFTDMTPPNLLLGPLANNGGTDANDGAACWQPCKRSWSTGANGCLATGRRGVSRPQGSACDVGALEYVLWRPHARRVGGSSRDDYE